MKHYIKLSAFFVFLFIAPVSLAWNTLGHMVVANIAYQYLTPPAREKVDELVNYFNQEYPAINSFPALADWADELREQKIETYAHWHYIDMPFSNDGTPLKNIADTDNAVWALTNIQIALANKHANNYERARFLGFFAHIVADLHQPLHTTSRLSTEHPNGDEGGNLYFIIYHGDRINLHKIWDEGLGTLTESSSSEHVNALSASIISHYPESYFGKSANDLNPTDWVQEGNDHAKTYVYDTPEEATPAQAYFDEGTKLTEQELALAGYRLAHFLNQLLTS